MKGRNANEEAFIKDRRDHLAGKRVPNPFVTNMTSYGIPHARAIEIHEALRAEMDATLKEIDSLVPEAVRIRNGIESAGHEHKFGPFEESRFAGTLHRKCVVPGCKAISLDGDEEESE